MKKDLGIIGVSATPVAEESQHFELWPICGQSFDCRDLAQAMHHAEPVHEPLLPEERPREMVDSLKKQ